MTKTSYSLGKDFIIFDIGLGNYLWVSLAH